MMRFRCVAGESKQLAADDSTTEQTRDTEANTTRIIELQSQNGKLRLDFANKKLVIDADGAIFDAIREEVKNRNIEVGSYKHFQVLFRLNLAR